MQLDYLKYLIAIKEYGSMNQAAKHLYVSQQNISKTIKRLEQEFGHPILEQGIHKCVFTKEGERLYEYALAYETKRKELRNRLAKQSLKNINGTVRIGTMSTGSTVILPQVLATHYKNYPNITLQIFEGSFAMMVEGLLNGKIDLAVVIMIKANGKECFSLPEQIRAKSIAPCRTCYWISKKNPLAKQNKVSMNDIVKEPVLISSRSDLDLMRELYKVYGAELVVAAENENPYLLGKLTAENFGVLSDIALNNDKWMLRYIFEDNDDVIALPVDSNELYESKLCLLTNRQKEKTVLEKHITNFILDGKWKE